MKTLTPAAWAAIPADYRLTDVEGRHWIVSRVLKYEKPEVELVEVL